MIAGFQASYHAVGTRLGDRGNGFDNLPGGDPTDPISWFGIILMRVFLSVEPSRQ